MLVLFFAITDCNLQSLVALECTKIYTKWLHISSRQRHRLGLVNERGWLARTRSPENAMVQRQRTQGPGQNWGERGGGAR